MGGLQGEAVHPGVTLAKYQVTADQSNPKMFQSKIEQGEVNEKSEVSVEFNLNGGLCDWANSGIYCRVKRKGN